MRNTMLALFLNGVMFGLIKLFYEIVPEPMSVLLYCTFLGFTVTFSVGAQIRELRAYLGSIVIGSIWVAGFAGVENMFLSFMVPLVGAKVIAFGFMSFLIEASNLLGIGKLKLKYIPLQFAVVIGVFSQQCEHIPYVLISLIIGILAALLSKRIYLRFLPIQKDERLVIK